MLLGHIAVGFAAKKASPGTPLVLLMVASELVDILWPVFVLIGIEVADIAPGITAANPLDLKHYPWSHSLVMHFVWGCLLGGVVYFLRKNRREAIVLASAVVSHWALDVISHRPDMPVAPWMDVKLGLGVWNSVAATLVVENALFATGIALYLRATRPKNRIGTWAFWSFAVFMAAMFLANTFSPPPPNIQVVAISGIVAWVLYLWVWWIDRNREAVETTSPPVSRGR